MVDNSEQLVGEFAPFKYGVGLPERSRNPLGHVPVFGSNGIVGFHDKSLTNGPTVVIGRKGTVGAIHYSPVPCWPIDTTFFITGSDPRLVRYKYYALESLGLRQMNSDSAVPGLNRDAAHSRSIRVPEEADQRAIAYILGTLDDKIELNRKMSQTLEDISQALFKSWFVDFDTVHAKAEEHNVGLPQNMADLFPDSFENSEMGEIPKGWMLCPMGEIAEIVGGSTPSTTKPEYWQGGTHYWATPKDLASLKFPVLLDTERRITAAGVQEIGSGILPPGTVLLSSRAPIGYLAIAEVPIAINQGFVAMKAKKGISNLFLLYWARFAHEYILSKANGSTFLEINKSNYRSLLVKRPDDDVLKAFDTLVRPMHQRVVNNEHQSHTLVGLRELLLPKLISGEFRIRDAERIIKGVE